jgi:hypothetical protein
MSFHFFSLSVLGWAVGASWFDFVAKFHKGHINEGLWLRQVSTLVAPNESTEGPVAAKCAKKEAHDFHRRAFTLGKEYPRHRRFVIHDEEIWAVPVVRVDNAVAGYIWVAVIDGRCTDKAEVHVESGTGVSHLLSFSTGSTFTDPSLLFSINVTKQVEFKVVWEADCSGSERDKLIFAAVAQMGGPEFGF